MERLSFEEKLQEAKLMSEKGRPIANLSKAVKSNESPEYASESLRKRSKSTAAERAKRYNRVAGELSKA